MLTEATQRSDHHVLRDSDPIVFQAATSLSLGVRTKCNPGGKTSKEFTQGHMQEAVSGPSH